MGVRKQYLKSDLLHELPKVAKDVASTVVKKLTQLVIINHD